MLVLEIGRRQTGKYCGWSTVFVATYGLNNFSLLFCRSAHNLKKKRIGTDNIVSLANIFSVKKFDKI